MIVITNAAGQLCNRLVLLAHAYATGLESGQKTIHLVANDLKKDILLSDDRLIVFSKDTKWIFNYYEKIMGKIFGGGFRSRNRDKIDDIRLCLNRKGIHILNNWYYRDYDALFKHRNDIIRAFAPVEKYAVKIDSFVESIKAQYPGYILTGVHIRRGDYRTWRNGRFYFDNETFSKWITEMYESSGQKMVFIIFSNEPITPEDFENCPAKIIKGPDHPIEDLYVMSKCDYIFGPPSSYSWWAAFYGGKKYLTMHSRTQTISKECFSLVKGEEFEPEQYLDNKGE